MPYQSVDDGLGWVGLGWVQKFLVGLGWVLKKWSMTNSALSAPRISHVHSLVAFDNGKSYVFDTAGLIVCFFVFN